MNEVCYAGLIHSALEFSPTLSLLESGAEGWLSNCRSQPWDPHLHPSKLEQDKKLEYLLLWVREYYVREGDLSLVAHPALFDAYPGTKHKLTNLVAQELVDESILLKV